MSLTDAQIELRRHGIGASEIAAVAGLSPHATAFEVWAQKITGQQIEQTDAMELGHLLEAPIATFYARRNPDVELRECGTLRHPEHPWALATPDRLVVQNDNVVRLLEVKTAGLRAVSQWGDDDDAVPEHYLAQVQWQLFVTGQHVVDVAALVAGAPRFYRIERSEVVIGFLFERAQVFMEHLRTESPPPFDGSKAAQKYLLDKFPRPTDAVRDATDEEQALLQRYLAAHRRETAAKAEKSVVAQQLMDRVGDFGGLRMPGARAQWITPDGNSMQWAEVARELGAEQHPEIVAKYSAPLPRRLDVRAVKIKALKEQNR